MERLYGLNHSRDPRIIIVIGRIEPLPEHRRRVLEQMNLSLHRVEIVPYDVIGKRAIAWAGAVESYIQTEDEALELIESATHDLSA
jgi:hypothetical protein